MSEQFYKIVSMYQENFRKHGDSPSALMTPKGRSDLRFRALDPFVQRPHVKVLDYGCGLGYLRDYFQKKAVLVNYTGLDMLPEFIETCRKKPGGQASFELLGAHDPIPGNYDVVFASGVFNLRSDTDKKRSREYVFRRLQELFSACSEVLVCDFLSSYVDFTQPDGQHFSPAEIIDFCVNNLSRRFIIRQDLLPYEFTLIAWAESSIRRPDNIYEVDASNT
jgi:SAM-dependent methyltransferase